MVEQVIGNDFALWNSSLFAKPASDGQATPWHQDGEYWPIRPVATCTVWIAVDDANTSNGCLRVIPGSHKREDLLRHRTNPDPNLTLNQELLPGNSMNPRPWIWFSQRARFPCTMCAWCMAPNPTGQIDHAAE
ncbi:MAG: hypothetical protein Ct9H300mP16_00250 [Pseudomonadota bacterium]|nr:MAG: hypothetical protein Ct9H300mP16_00250 [Pseudomonadota bacterium]